MLHTPNSPLALMILDGWGHADATNGNAIKHAHTPYFDAMCAAYPTTTLIASGPTIGQEPGEFGNAEAGHLCIGTGRAAHGDVSRVERAIRSGEFEQSTVLKDALEKAAASEATIHLIGLLSDGGIHSSSESVYTLLRLAKASGAADVAIHCILDGVDVPTRTADIYVEALEIKMADIGVGRVASLCGRYFGMDSRGNWERTARAYTMLVHGEGESSADAVSSIRNSFLRGIADEFIAPIVIQSGIGDAPSAVVKNGDLVIYFNHRPETMSQLVRSLSVPDSMGTPKPLIDSICLTEYDRNFELPVAFPAETAVSSLTDILGRANLHNFKITQSERFPHLNYFFNGGAESQSSNEQTILLPTPRGEALDLSPESQSFKITDKSLRAFESMSGGVFIVNIPAAGLVADTGRFDKVVESIQFIDTCLGSIVGKIASLGGTTLVTSSYGRCEQMTEPEPEMIAHNSSNPVPLVVVGEKFRGSVLREGGSLADIAPTILDLLSLERPSEMSGLPLFG